LPVPSLNTKNIVIPEVNVKGRVFPKICHVGRGELRCSSTYSHPHQWLGVGGQRHTVAVELQGRSPGTCFTGVWVALRGRSGQRRENLLPTRQFESCIIQPVARHYLDPIVTSLLQIV